MFAGTRSRRDLDRTQRRAAANRRIGHEMAWFYFWERPIKFAVLGGLLFVGGRLLWTRVDHGTIAGVSGGVGLILVLAYGAWLASTSSAYARSIRAARGGSRGNAMHFVALAGALLIAAAFVIWSQG